VRDLTGSDALNCGHPVGTEHPPQKPTAAAQRARTLSRGTHKAVLVEHKRKASWCEVPCDQRTVAPHPFSLHH
jgi:hypothetical protein